MIPKSPSIIILSPKRQRCTVIACKSVLSQQESENSTTDIESIGAWGQQTSWPSKLFIITSLQKEEEAERRKKERSS